MNTLNNQILTSLNGPADYSLQFDQRVSALSNFLTARLGLSFIQNRDMNYSSSQTLEVPLDGDGNPISTNASPSYRFVLFLSSKGPFLAIIVYCKRNGTLMSASPVPFWERCNSMEWSEKVSDLYRKVVSLLEEEGIIEIRDLQWDIKVEGHFTEMDNHPATLFEILFSEIV